MPILKRIPVSSAVEDREIYGVDEYKVYLNNGMKMEFDSSGTGKKLMENTRKYLTVLFLLPSEIIL